jgi:hypothetical protein
MDSIAPQAGLRIVDYEDGTFAVFDYSKPVEEDAHHVFYPQVADGFTSRLAAWRYIVERGEASLERGPEPCTSPANDKRGHAISDDDDLFSEIMKRDDVTFPEAVERVAGKVIPFHRPADGATPLPALIGLSNDLAGIAMKLAMAGATNDVRHLSGCVADLRRIASMLAPFEFRDGEEAPF